MTEGAGEADAAGPAQTQSVSVWQAGFLQAPVVCPAAM